MLSNVCLDEDPFYDWNEGYKRGYEQGVNDTIGKKNKETRYCKMCCCKPVIRIYESNDGLKKEGYIECPNCEIRVYQNVYNPKHQEKFLDDEIITTKLEYKWNILMKE